MYKFKIGDKVRIVKNVWDTIYFAPKMGVGMGEVHTIFGIDTANKNYPYILDAHKGYTWCEDELELVEEKKMFTKADLKNGDVVKKRCGHVEILVLPVGSLVCEKKDCNHLSDINEDLTSVNGEEFDIVAVRRPTSVRHCRFDAFDCELGELVYERDPKPTKSPYNGKVVCIDLCGSNLTSYTVGKIYQFKDGVLINDNGTKLTGYGDGFHSFEEWNDWSSSKFIEIKE